MAERPVGPGVGSGEKRAGSWGGEIAPGIVGVIHSSTLGKTRQIRHGLSRVTMEGNVLGGERIEDQKEDIGRLCICRCTL